MATETEVQEATPAEKAVLSRFINEALEIDLQIKVLKGRLGTAKTRIYDQVGGAPGVYQSQKGHVEIRKTQALSLSVEFQDVLEELLGDRYFDVIEEEVKLVPKSGLRRLVFEPNPFERPLSEALNDLVTIKDQLSITLKKAKRTRGKSAGQEG